MAIVDLGQFFDFDKIIAKSQGLIDINGLLDDSYEDLIKRGKEVSSALNKSLSDITKQSDELAKSLSKGNKTQEEYLESLSKTKKESDSLVDTYKAVDKELKKVEKSTSDLEKEQKDVNKAFAEATKEAKELEKLSDRLAKANSDQAKSEAFLKAQINQKNAELRKSAKEALESSNAFKDLTARTNRAQMRFKTLSAELQEAEINFGKNSQEVRRLAQQVDRAEKEFNELDGRLRTINGRAKDGRRDVGRYAIAFDGLDGALGGSISRVKQFNAQLLALLANPVALVIGAIVAALAALAKGWSTTIAGAERLQKVTVALSTGFNTLFRQIGRLVSGELTLANFFSETTNAIQDNVEASNDLVEIRRALEDQTVRNNISEAEQARVIEKLRGIRDNDLISLQRRLEAARELQREEEVLSNLRIIQAEEEANQVAASLRSLGLAENDLNEAIQNRSLSLFNNQKISEDQRKGLNELGTSLANIIALESELDATRAETAQQTGTLILDILDQELDFLIDIDERRVENNRRAIARESTTAELRNALIKENSEIVESSLAAQIASFERYLGVQVDLNKILSLSGKEAFEYATALGFPERAAIRLIEVVNSAKVNVEDLNEELITSQKEYIAFLTEFEQQKANVERQSQQERLRTTLEFVDRQFELERNQIELTDKTEEEKTQLVLKAERKKLQARLRALQLLGDITRQEADIIKSEIDLVNKEIEESGRGILGGLLFILENVGQRAIQLAGNISAISEGIAERQRQRDEQRLTEIEQNRERQIEIAGDNQEAIARINARADKQEEQIQERQRARQIRIARRQKALAISQSIIDTAVAVVGALKNPPGPPFTIPFAVAAGALGATQTAAIAAQPLPAFEKGGIVKEDSPLIWNEKGYEYAVTPEGKLVKSQGQGAQITNDIPKGSVILNHAISKQLDKDLSIEKRYKSMPEETKGILKYIQQEKESIAIKMAHSLKRENDALLEEIHALVGAVPSKIELGVRKGELHGWVVGANKANSERKKGYRYGNKG